MSADADTITVGDPLPRIASVRHASDHVLSVTWAAGRREGITEEVDLAPVIMTYKVFLPLREDVDLFSGVQIVENGHALEWMDGRIDMAATTVERLASEAMSNEEFRAFMSRHGLTLDATSAVLGISRRQAAYYAKDKPVPRLVALACAGYEAKQVREAA